MSGCWALLPLKDLVQAKTRLGGVLASHERRALAQAMAEDVLAALAAAHSLSGVLLVSDDPGADLLAGKYGVDWLPESELGVHGLNAVVASGCEMLEERGASQVMVVHCDLPLLRPADVDQLYDQFTAQALDLLLVPDRRGEGTNILLTGTHQLPAFHYGHDSFTRHQAAARQQGLTVGHLPLEDAALDIDQPADLIDAWRRLSAGPEGRSAAHTGALLARSDIGRRLAALSELYSANSRGAL